MNRKTLTPRQQEIFELLGNHIREHGYPPTRLEICKQLGFRSPNAAEEHLRALARKGVIELQSGRSRGIRLVGDSAVSAVTLEESSALFSLPLVGRVAAGSPILAEENIENHITMDPSLFRPVPDYLLQVQGMSMQNAGILDGDLLAVHRTLEARNRQIVVARLGDEVTVKRFWRKGHQVQLLPENPDFEPIEVDLRAEELIIEGLGVGVIRNIQ